jgi:hypothetical protein
MDPQACFDDWCSLILTIHDPDQLPEDVDPLVSDADELVHAYNAWRARDGYGAIDKNHNVVRVLSVYGEYLIPDGTWIKVEL